MSIRRPTFPNTGESPLHNNPVTWEKYRRIPALNRQGSQWNSPSSSCSTACRCDGARQASIRCDRLATVNGKVNTLFRAGSFRECDGCFTLKSLNELSSARLWGHEVQGLHAPFSLPPPMLRLASAHHNVYAKTQICLYATKEHAQWLFNSPNFPMLMTR